MYWDGNVYFVFPSGNVDDGDYYYVKNSYGNKALRSRIIPTTFGLSSLLATSTSATTSTVSTIPTEN